VLWGDDIFDAEPSRCQQLVSAYERFGGSAILGSMRAGRPDDYKRYGYAAGKEVEDGVLKIDQLIEKPGSPDKVNSDLAVVSGSVLTSEIFDAIDQLIKKYDPTSGKELTYIDAINLLLAQGKACYAAEIKNGKYHDCGNKLEYLKTVVEYGLKHEDLREDFAEFLKQLKP